MTKYEKLLVEAENKGITVLELDMGNDKPYGKNFDDIIVLNRNMTEINKRCVLAEELGHYYRTYGDICRQDCINDIKQENTARKWSYEQLIGVIDLVNSHKHGCSNMYDIAEYLEVPVDILENAIEHYKCKYPDGCQIDNYWVNFDSGLEVLEMF